MCKFSKSGGVPFQPLGDLTWNDPVMIITFAIDMWFRCALSKKKKMLKNQCNLEYILAKYLDRCYLLLYFLWNTVNGFRQMLY